jgi:lipopolysaccharide/colanic/teichoic acid biosynthesis glycosyltransferase
MKRIFDIVSSFVALLLGMPFFLIIALFIVLSSKGGVFFVQKRVGKNNVDFNLLKFRTMKTDSESKGQITVGNKDPRITKLGYWLRKFKMDEFPQLINVIKGDMSIVGPRPEVRKYVSLYSDEQLKVLTVRPGLTDIASLEYIDENELLGKSTNPEATYINEIMPKKLELNLKYIAHQSLWLDIKLIFKTFFKILT